MDQWHATRIFCHDPPRRFTLQKPARAPYRRMSQEPSPRALYRTYLQHLLHLRLVALGGQALAYLIAARNPHFAFPFPTLSLLGGALLLYTLHALHRVPARSGLGEQAILAETCIDLASLTLALYLTGGSSNPLVSLLLLPVTVATATLRPALSWGVAGTAAGCYTFLMFLHRPFVTAHHHAGAFELHVWGMWYGFLLSTLLVALFVARIGQTLRSHDQALAKASEEALRHEQWLALGTLAAGTAHELGTPLSTIAVVSADLADEYEDDPELAERLAMLRSQTERCKDILSRMAMEAGATRADAGRLMGLDEYLRELMEDWSSVRPQTRIDAQWRGTRPAPRIVADRALTQAIHNILNNAADASPRAVAVEASWDGVQLRIDVNDQGEGLAPAVRQQIGHPLVSGKTDQGGLGLGLFLAQTVLERLGGQVDLSPREPSGVRARITLPLAPLLVAEGP
jgi:two-component system, sensor histidine kinase RegB